MDKIIIYVDGGSRGNPGPAASGVFITDQKGTVIKEYGCSLGEKTNNEAEYSAAIFALEKIKLLYGKNKAKDLFLEIRSDSQLLVEQINGRYKIVNEKLIPLFLKLWNLKIEFKQVEFVLIPRQENQEADRLVNQALDAEKGRLC
jgi:ribonuclease HI